MDFLIFSDWFWFFLIFPDSQIFSDFFDFPLILLIFPEEISKTDISDFFRLNPIFSTSPWLFYWFFIDFTDSHENRLFPIFPIFPGECLPRSTFSLISMIFPKNWLFQFSRFSRFFLIWSDSVQDPVQNPNSCNRNLSIRRRRRIDRLRAVQNRISRLSLGGACRIGWCAAAYW